MGSGARLPVAAPSPLPGPRWKSRCVLDSCIFKVGRWARNRRARTALNCKRALKQLLVRALDSQARGSGAGFERAPGPGGEAGGGAGVGPWRALQSQGLGPGPRRTAGGAEAWPLAARGSSPCASLRGAWHSLASPQLPGGPDPRPPTFRTPPRPPAGREPLLDSEAGRGRSPRTEPGQAATKGQLFMGRPGVLPRPALPSASREKWGEDRGKVPRAKLATVLIFPSAEDHKHTLRICRPTGEAAGRQATTVLRDACKGEPRKHPRGYLDYGGQR